MKTLIMKTLIKKINKELILFTLSSLSTSAVDALIYGVLVKTIFNPDKMSTGILISTTIARIVSCLLNYIINKEKVFNSNDNSSNTLVKFAIMSIAIMLMSSLLVTILFNLTHIESIIIKVVVDTCLFFVSYGIQKKYIF